MLGPRFEVDVDDHADRFFPGGNAAVHEMGLFAPDVFLGFLEFVGNALGANSFAGNAFFVYVQYLVIFNDRGRFDVGTLGCGRAIAVPIASASSAASAPTAAARFAVAVAFVGFARRRRASILNVGSRTFALDDVVVVEIAGKLGGADLIDRFALLTAARHLARGFVAVAASASATTATTTTSRLTRLTVGRFGGMTSFGAIER